MSRRLFCLLPALLLLAYAHPASADSDPNPRAVASVSAQGLDQIVYKGVVGNVLDGIPMDPSKRVSLQRTNAIISNTLSGRSLAALAGMSNPVLLIGGLVWGVWAASNIKAEDDGVQAMSEPGRAGAQSAPQPGLVALLDKMPAAAGTAQALESAPAATTPFSTVGPVDPPRVRAPVLKVWLPQRSSSVAGAQ